MEPIPKRPRIDFESCHCQRLLRYFIHRPVNAFDVLQYFSFVTYAIEDVLAQTIDDFGQFKLSLVVRVIMSKVNPATGEVISNTFFFRSRTKAILITEDISSTVTTMFDVINEQVSL